MAKQNGARSRLHSWSRPSRKMSLEAPESDRKWQSDCRIEGQATLAFSPSGSWFQGNVISPTEDAYTVTGRRRSLAHFNKDASRKTSFQTNSSESTVFESQEGSFPYSNSLEGDLSRKSSFCDSLDSELVRVALETFQFEEECEAYYDITIVDFETGMEHNVQGVSFEILSKKCSLSGDSLAFSSSSCSRGSKADMVLTKFMGPKLSDQNLLVFQGPFTYVYNDLTCYPTSAKTSNWCL